MRCKDCSSFKKNGNIEAGSELVPNIKGGGGRCSVTDKNCAADDTCGCGGFKKK